MTATTPRSEPAILTKYTLMTEASPRFPPSSDPLVSLECQPDRFSRDTVPDRQLAEPGTCGPVGSQALTIGIG